MIFHPSVDVIPGKRKELQAFGFRRSRHSGFFGARHVKMKGTRFEQSRLLSHVPGCNLDLRHQRSEWQKPESTNLRSVLIFSNGRRVCKLLRDEFGNRDRDAGSRKGRLKD